MFPHVHQRHVTASSGTTQVQDTFVESLAEGRHRNENGPSESLHVHKRDFELEIASPARK